MWNKVKMETSASLAVGDEAVELATLEWVFWFNHQRLMEPLGYIAPAEAEANYHRQLSQPTAPAA